MHNKIAETTVIALVFTLAMAGPTLAQAPVGVGGGDVLGITPIAQAVTVIFRIIAGVGVGWGFLRLMSGRHTVDGLLIMAIGVLGVAKSQALAQYLGL